MNMWKERDTRFFEHQDPDIQQVEEWLYNGFLNFNLLSFLIESCHYNLVYEIPT